MPEASAAHLSQTLAAFASRCRVDPEAAHVDAARGLLEALYDVEDRDGAIVAAAISAAALVHASELLTLEAVVVGREIAARFERALENASFEEVWDRAVIAARFGAALAAARALQLDETQSRHVLGLAATQAAGLRVAADSPAAAFALAKAASDALESALLCRHGFTAAAASIEGRRGFAAVMANGLDERALVDGLGHVWIS